jgi:hypothetical protein
MRLVHHLSPRYLLCFQWRSKQLTFDMVQSPGQRLEAIMVALPNSQSDYLGVYFNHKSQGHGALCWMMAAPCLKSPTMPDSFDGVHVLRARQTQVNASFKIR